MNLLLIVFSVMLQCSVGFAEAVNTSDVISSSAETTANVIETTTPKAASCSSRNSSCEKCVEDPQCYYCRKTKKCAFYPYTHIAPRPGECDSLGDVAWGTCIVNFEILIISMSVIAGVLVLGIVICCCCWCRKRGRDKWAKQQDKWEKDREERKARNEERRKERQAKTDEIRRKYGLLLDVSGLKIGDDNPYQRFDT